MSHSIQQTHIDPEVVPGSSLDLLWYWRWYWWYWRWYKLRWYLVPHFNGLLFMDGCLQQQRVIQFNPRHYCSIDQSLNQQWENVLEHIAVLDTLCVQYCNTVYGFQVSSKHSWPLEKVCCLMNCNVFTCWLMNYHVNHMKHCLQQKKLVSTHWYDPIRF